MNRARNVSSRRLGVVVFAIIFVIFGVLFNKGVIDTWLMSGSTIKVHFAGDYKLRPNLSVVKVGYVPVGKVTEVQRESDGSALVTLKVKDSALDVLGSAPSAAIRSTTILGGSYFVDLAKGGDPGRFSGEIPEARTSLPVELDAVTQAFQPDALKAMQGTIATLNGSLGARGANALQRLMDVAPGTLIPAAGAFQAAQGNRPTQDWQTLVPNLENLARDTSAQNGQLARILVNLQRTSDALGGGSAALANTVGQLPQAEQNADSGLQALNTTLDTLTATSAQLRPTARQLRSTLDDLNPVLAKAVPVVTDLRQVSRDLLPSVTNLRPAASGLTAVANDVRGPVIQRVNGPVLTWLNSGYRGTGPYSQTSTDLPMYKEIGSTAADVARASSMVDGNGHTIAFQPGLGPGSVGGLPISIQQYFNLANSWLVTGPSNLSTTTGVSSTLNGLLASILGKA